MARRSKILTTFVLAWLPSVAVSAAGEDRRSSRSAAGQLANNVATIVPSASRLYLFDYQSDLFVTLELVQDASSGASTYLGTAGAISAPGAPTAMVMVVFPWDEGDDAPATTNESATKGYVLDRLRPSESPGEGQGEPCFRAAIYDEYDRPAVELYVIGNWNVQFEWIFLQKRITLKECNDAALAGCGAGNVAWFKWTPDSCEYRCKENKAEQ